MYDHFPISDHAKKMREKLLKFMDDHIYPSEKIYKQQVEEGAEFGADSARYVVHGSGLSVLDFVKRTSILKLGPEQLKALAPAAMELARVEGLDAHGRSVGIRVNL